MKINDTLPRSQTQPLNHGMLQGLALVHILFTICTAPLSKLIQGFKYITHHLYADDIQIYTRISPKNVSSHLRTLQDCIFAIQKWTMYNKFKLSPDMTGFFFQPLNVLNWPLSPIDLRSSLVSPSNNVKNLGVFRFLSDLFDDKSTNHLQKYSV